MNGGGGAGGDQPLQEAESSEEPSEETHEERINRNWEEMLQELRVTQTGVQILAGFLLTLPFQQRFPELDSVQRTAYLMVLAGAVIAVSLMVAPVSYHRLLFRQGAREWLVKAGDRAARAGLVTLAFTISGVLWLVFDVVVGRLASSIAGPVALAFFAGLWWAVPMMANQRDVAQRTQT